MTRIKKINIIFNNFFTYICIYVYVDILLYRRNRKKLLGPYRRDNEPPQK